MLGPSPDWNVGLSAEDLCTKECGWAQKVVQDLIPWDAGTDSGVSYEVSDNNTVNLQLYQPLWQVLELHKEGKKKRKSSKISLKKWKFDA